MRHQKNRIRLKQKPAHSKMMKRNLLTSVLLYESIRTTKNRAKAVQPLIDKLVAYAKKRPPHVAIRYINRYVTDKNACRKIMEVYVNRYKTRPSGLSRIVPAGARGGDGAQVVDLTLMDAVIGSPIVEEVKEVAKKPAKKPAAEKKAPAAEKKTTEPKKKPSTPTKK